MTIRQSALGDLLTSDTLRLIAHCFSQIIQVDPIDLNRGGATIYHALERQARQVEQWVDSGASRLHECVSTNVPRFLQHVIVEADPRLPARVRAVANGHHIRLNRPSLEGLNRREIALLAHEATHVLQQQSLGLTFPQFAEVDDFILPTELDDSAALIDAYVNQALTMARTASLEAGLSVGSEDYKNSVLMRTYDLLAGNGMLYGTIENWANGELGERYLSKPPKADSKYAGTHRLWVKFYGASLKANDKVFGVDKLGHFFQQGYQYYQRFKDLPHDADADRIKAKKEAQKIGHHLETSIQGLGMPGVYSNADLIANRDGLNFYLNLYENTEMSFSIGSYATELWNESITPCYYPEDMLFGVWRSILMKSDWKGTMQDNTTRQVRNLEVEFSDLDRASFTTNDLTFKGSLTVTKETALEPLGVQIQGVVVYRAVRLEFNWEAGGRKGKGVFQSHKELQLDGMWGENQSTDNNGRITLIRFQR